MSFYLFLITNCFFSGKLLVNKQLDEKVEKAARRSHKERVAELNRKLEEMTEHYDIPKVTNSFV